MGTPGIIITVNVLKNRKRQIVKRIIKSAVGFFEFEVFKEALSNGVVVRMTFFRKGLNDVAVIQNLSK